MSFLGTARALDDATFRWRVMGACLAKAKTLAAAPVAPDRNYGIAVLLSPQLVDPSMLALVAVDPTVADAIITGEDGAVDTTPVTDDQIAAAVTLAWPLVAVKYQADPLATGAA